MPKHWTLTSAECLVVKCHWLISSKCLDHNTMPSIGDYLFIYNFCRRIAETLMEFPSILTSSDAFSCCNIVWKRISLLSFLSPSQTLYHTHHHHPMWIYSAFLSRTSFLLAKLWRTEKKDYFLSNKIPILLLLGFLKLWNIFTLEFISLFFHFTRQTHTKEKKIKNHLESLCF